MEITGAITWLSSFRTIGLAESEPAALDTFRFERSLATPEVEISMSGMERYLQFILLGSRFIRDAVPLRSLLWHNLMRLSVDLIEKTDFVRLVGSLTHITCTNCIYFPHDRYALCICT